MPSRAEQKIIGAVELLVGCVQVEQKLQHLVDDLVAGARPGRSILLTTTMTLCPSSSAFCSTNRVCGIGPFKRVDQQQNAVDHLQDALHLAAKIGVARACRRC